MPLRKPQSLKFLNYPLFPIFHSLFQVLFGKSRAQPSNHKQLARLSLNSLVFFTQSEISQTTEITVEEVCGIKLSLFVFTSVRLIASKTQMADSEEPQPPEKSEKVCNFFRKPTKSKNIRKRSIDTLEEGEDNEDQEPSVVFKNKKPPRPDNKLTFSTGSSKRTATDGSTEPKSDTRIFQFDSSKEVQVHHDGGATATLETETDFSRDARAIRERVLKQAENSLKGKGKGSGDEKLYKGMNAYTDHKAGFRREQTISSEKAGGSHGPLRASAHIRVSARFDYQPDICKDYKETGYCGFGDSCKFMHDRGDYKSGWQMEREWEEAEKVRKRNLAMGVDDDDDEEGEANKSDDEDDDALPFACFICRQPFVDPVVTKCKHYFCEHCALKHHSKNKKCFVCNQPTLGIFNTAHEIKKKMEEESK